MSEARFGDYRVTDTIGTGALSTIYRAIQEPVGRVVALKALKAQIAPTSSFGEQLAREAKILADLAHPNVVLLLEASRSTSGRPYVVLELVDGPSLHEVLEREAAPRAPHGARTRERSTTGGKAKPKPGGLGVAPALAIACGVCAALEHIHERGIVHRDVKPGNILLARSGVVKVIDFGIAQRPRTHSVSDGFGEGITPSGRMAPEMLKDAFGTPAYMSPEQILGDFVDGRSDLFSLGVVLYQMLSGVRPFETPDGDEGKRSAAQRIRRDAPPALRDRDRAPDCPRAVERIVMRLLEKSPNERYPSAGAVRERLEAALRAETREDPASLVRASVGDRASASDGDGTRARASTKSPTSKTYPTAFTPTAPVVTATAPNATATYSTKRTATATVTGTESTATARRSRLTRSVAGARPVGLRVAFLGYGAVTFLFTVVVLAVELSGGGSRDGRAAGGRPLELAPDHAGGLRVVATPWAKVRVDGQLVETTPFARPIPLAAGKHWVTLSHPDAPSSIERSIDLVAGETMTLEVTLDVSTDDAGKDAR